MTPPSMSSGVCPPGMGGMMGTPGMLPPFGVLGTMQPPVHAPKCNRTCTVQ